MKPSQQVDLSLSLNPEISRQIAAEATANLSDEEAVARAAYIQSALKGLMDDVQSFYLSAAAREHDASDEKRLIADHAASVVDALSSALDALAAGSGPVPALDDPTLSLIRRILSASELLLYPCMQFTDTLTAREIIHRGEPFVKLLASLPPDATSLTLSQDDLASLRSLTSPDILALRQVTDEYRVQSRIFDLLRKYCRAVSARLKSLGAHDAALEGLALVEILDKREKDYRECLLEGDAAAFTDGLRTFQQRFRRELSYAAL